MTTSMPCLSATTAARNLDPLQNSLRLVCIHKQQKQDQQLLALQSKYPEQFMYDSQDEDLEDISATYI